MSRSALGSRTFSSRSSSDVGDWDGEVHALTYNVAGLPEILSGSNPEVNTDLIGPKLNDFDLVVMQETWETPDPNPLAPTRVYFEILAGGVDDRRGVVVEQRRQRGDIDGERVDQNEALPHRYLDQRQRRVIRAFPVELRVERVGGGGDGVLDERIERSGVGDQFMVVGITHARARRRLRVPTQSTPACRRRR